jgi:hypothetical protein
MHETWPTYGAHAWQKREKHVFTYHGSHIVARRALCIILIANGQGRLGIICEGGGMEHVPKSIRTTVLTDEQDLAKPSAVSTWISEQASRGKPKIPLLIAGTHICESNIKKIKNGDLLREGRFRCHPPCVCECVEGRAKAE